jgi:hypothetical protein
MDWSEEINIKQSLTTIQHQLTLVLANQETIMSNQAEEASLAAQIETDVTEIEAAQQTALTEIEALQTAAANGQPLDFSAAIQAVTDLGTAATGAQAVATAAAPPAAPAAPAEPAAPTA